MRAALRIPGAGPDSPAIWVAGAEVFAAYVKPPVRPPLYVLSSALGATRSASSSTGCDRWDRNLGTTLLAATVPTGRDPLRGARWVWEAPWPLFSAFGNRSP